MKNKVSNNRLLSIDVLRGFDMLMIIFADRFFYHLNIAAQTETTGFFATQFEHPKWFGFHFYDIIMPLFLFLVGVVIPFSMERRVAEIDNKAKLYPHIIKRFVILFFLGWVVQGNLLALDITKFQIFSNTLQAIAVGYLFSCVAFIHLNKKLRYILFVVCLIVFALLLEFAPVPGIGRSKLLPNKNIALYIDHYIFGRFDDGYQYTWLLSGLGFISTTLSGVFAGEMLRLKIPREKIALKLVKLGFLLLIVGLILHVGHPSVKKIWNSTFVLISSGICTLMLVLFYWLIDVKGFINWGFLFKVIGVNAITAYVLSHVFNFPEISKYLLFGFEPFIGNYYNVLATILGFGILYLLLWYMNKNKTYIKI
ncbi:MAG: DUF5009 domain-containing protein [Algibacter sp.]|uniref:acyltransferase family protein n=1 Tax=Algibacter sp. TaxID=1872428 RepID=UPI00329988BA